MERSTRPHRPNPDIPAEGATEVEIKLVGSGSPFEHGVGGSGSPLKSDSHIFGISRGIVGVDGPVGGSGAAGDYSAHQVGGVNRIGVDGAKSDTAGTDVQWTGSGCDSSGCCDRSEAQGSG